MASCIMRYDAMKSVPSTSPRHSPGKPATSFEMLPPAVWHETGTEMAYPLSSTRKSTGRRLRQATLSDSQNSPSLVAPSPEATSVISSDAGARSRPASAQPTACRYCVPVGDDELTMLNFAWPQCEGIWRPPEEGSAAAPTACSSISSGVTPSARHSARSR